MGSVKMSHVGRYKIRKPRIDWRAMVNPIFLEAAISLREARASQPREQMADFLTRVDELYKKYSTLPETPAHMIYGTLGKWSNPPQQLGEVILSWLHWNRFRIPLWQDTTKAGSGDVSASKRITETVIDYDARRSDPNWKPSFRTDLEHAEMFELEFGLGLEKLTEEQLAECFDALCGCGKTHSSDALRKYRKRFARDLESARNWERYEAPKLVQRIDSQDGNAHL